MPDRGRPGRWRVTWTSGSAVKRVDITDMDTGTTVSGRDWASWDTAYRQALFMLARKQGS